MYKIHFEPLDRRGECPSDRSLLQAAQDLEIDLVSLCGGLGTCHRCKLRVLTGLVSPPTESERSTLLPQEIKDGYRLACQTYLLGDCKVYVPPESLTALQRTQVEGLDITVDLDPLVHSYKIELPSPSLSDLRADAERTLGMLYDQHQIKCCTIDIEVLRTLSLQIRSSDWNIQAS
ncbi:MAG: 2Fe-2S iron-sulfur cluster-binding protein, partial [Dehalococcoidia bacterium]|nr:2Fe-2S iron-sulfur cluster-binding protein [Dehalococcoidia bacterium]